MSTRNAIAYGAALLIAALLLWWSLRGIEWRHVGVLIASAEPVPLALAALLASFTLFLRALRWRVLLTSEGLVSVGTSFWATAGGYFGNNILPARAGELVRTYAVASQTSLDAAFVLATALGERAADAFFLVALGGLAIQWLPQSADWLHAAAKTCALIGMAGVVVIAVLPLVAKRLTAAFARVPIPARLSQLVVRAVAEGARGLHAFHSVPRLTAFVGYSVAIWSIDAASVVIGAAALGLRIPVAAALLLLAGLGLGSTLPSTPGYVGIYQFVAVTVLPPFGLSRSDAIAYIVVAQAMSYAVIGAWGAPSLFLLRRDRILRLERASADREVRP